LLRPLIGGRSLLRSNLQLRNVQIQHQTVPPLPTKITTLPSGLRIVTEDGFGVTATIGVWIDAGSALEDDSNNGVAHFLEHMAFKGTKKRSREDIEDLVENLGGQLNAYTTREHTCYITQCFDRDIPIMVDLLSDIIQNSRFDRPAIESERGTIKTEKEEVEKDFDEVIFDYLHMGAFQGTSLGLTILGREENIDRIQKQDLTKYISTHYTAPRVVLVGAGAVKHDQLVELGKEYFGNLPTNALKLDRTEPITWTPCDIRNPRIRKPGAPEEARVAVAWQGASWSDPDFFPLMVIQSLLGDWDYQSSGAQHYASRVAQSFANSSLAKSVQTFNTCYHSTGIVGFSIRADGETLFDSLEVALRALADLSRSLDEESLEIAKTKVKMASLVPLDGSMPVAEELGRQVLATGGRMTSDEYSRHVDAVTAKDVLSCLHRLFDDMPPVLVALGNISYLPPYGTIRELTNFEYCNSK